MTSSTAGASRERRVSASQAASRLCEMGFFVTFGVVFVAAAVHNDTAGKACVLWRASRATVAAAAHDNLPTGVSRVMREC